jgi:glucosylglycerate synthase
MEPDAVIFPELEQVEQLGGADVVIGILDSESADQGGAATAMVREALGQLTGIARAVVVCNNGAGPASSTPERNGDETGRLPVIFTCGLPARNPADTPQETVLSVYRNVFAIGGRLGARACGVIASQPRTATYQWISRLVQPVLDLGFDLVAPLYSRHKMEGLLNRSILSPLHRALYGERLQNPMGPDFGLSGKLLQRVLGQNSGTRRGADSLPAMLASLGSVAAAGGFQVCESHLGARTQRATDWANLSSLLAEILGPGFVEMERQAAFWQSVRGSKALPGLGVAESMPEDNGVVDSGRMIESFQLGTRNLQDVWDLVLPPGSLLELKKLARLSPGQFRMPDDLWVRIVYDFALAHRLRTISRDHLLRSITPLYLGWIASYALEMETAGPSEVEARIERLARAYEAGKPYLVSRWRWPDRFNP